MIERILSVCGVRHGYRGRRWISRRWRPVIVAGAVLMAAAAADPAMAQSSSLYVGGGENALQRAQRLQQFEQQRHAPQQRQAQGRPQAAQGNPQAEAVNPQAAQQVGGGGLTHPAAEAAAQDAMPLEQRVKGRVVHRQLQAMSFTAVQLPEPRHFAKHDLVTIIIREQTQASSSQSLSTSNDLRIQSELQAMPRLQLRDLLNFQLRGGDDENLPEFGLRHRNDWDGDGDYRRRDTMTTRLTGRVVDIKPNGTLTLEARTHIRTDGEEQTIVVTGHCRADDITGDNTILSTQIFDLRVEREHDGELRRVSEKGIFTRILDTVLNF